MKPLNFSPLTEAQFQSLAMGKAKGFTWSALAEQLQLPLAVVERVPWTHEKPWNRMLTKAEQLVAREALAEVASALRRDVRNAEPKLRPTAANSLARVLKLQQEYALPRRRRPMPNTAPNPTPNTAPNTPIPETSEGVPIPAVPRPSPSAKPAFGPLPSLQDTASAMLGLVVVVFALFMGCWNSQRPLGSEASAGEPVVWLDRPHEAKVATPENRPNALIVQTPPPWVREHPSQRHPNT